jgi:hypothetical protein
LPLLRSRRDVVRGEIEAVTAFAFPAPGRWRRAPQAVRPVTGWGPIRMLRLASALTRMLRRSLPASRTR